MTNNKRLTRNTDNKVLGGVCSGIADYFDQDPVLVRLLTVLFACIAGSGIVAYIIAWIIIPAKNTQS